MNLGRLVHRHAWSHPVRALLTVGAVAVAVFLFCFLRSVVTSLESAVSASASNRIATSSAVSLFQSLPFSYRETIAQMGGVESVSRFTWFGGIYKDPKNFFGQLGTDPDVMMGQYPELRLTDAERKAWLDDRRGAIVGIGLARKYGFERGQALPLQGTIFPRVDGSEWTFNVRGIYRSARANVDEMSMYFHAEYLKEAQERNECYGPRGTSVYMTRVRPGYRGEDVGAAIDRWYEGGPQRTRTQSEAAFQADFVNMLGNLPAFLTMVGAAVLAAIVLGIVNTMTLAGRERFRSMGILKSLGFPDSVPARLYLLESMSFVLSGGALGVLIAWLTQGVFRALFGTQIPMYAVAPETYLWAGVICIAVGLGGGAAPAWSAARMRAVDALRRGG